MADGSIVIDTKVDSSGAEKGVKGLSSGLGALAKKALPVAAVAASIKKVASELLKTAEVYKKQAKAEIQLETAARNNPYLDTSSVQKLKNYASELQKISTVGDEELLPFMAQLASSGRTQAEIQDIMRAALDASASGAVELGTAVRSLNQSYEGNVGALGRVLPSLKNLTAEELKQGGAVRAVSKAYEGMAKKTAEATGTAEQLNNAWGDFKENIGQTVEGALAPLRRKLTELLTDINKANAENNAKKQANEDIKKGLATTVSYETKIKVAEEQILDLTERRAKALAFGDSITAGELIGQIKQLEAIKQSYEIQKNILQSKENQKKSAQQQAEIDAQNAKKEQARVDLAVKAKENYKETVRLAEEDIKNRRALGEEISEEDEKQEMFNVKFNAYLEMLKESQGTVTGNVGEAKQWKEEILELSEAFKKDEALKLHKEEVKKLAEAYAELAMTINDSLANTFSMASDAVNKSAEADVKKLEHDYNKGLMTEEEYLKKKAEMEEEAAEKAYKLDMISWGLQVNQAAANAAMAVSSVWGDATIPTITKPIYTAIAAVNGAAALANVIAAKPVKKFEHGGIVPGTSYSGDNVTARVNSGEMILNQRQQQNMFNALNKGGMGGGASVVMPVQIINNSSANVSSRMDTRGLTVMIDEKVNASMAQGKYTQSMQVAESKANGARIL